MFKGSSLFAAVALLAASVGALTGTYLYLRKREKNLDEFEDILMGDYEIACDDCDDCEACAEAPEEALDGTDEFPQA